MDKNKKKKALGINKVLGKAKSSQNEFLEFLKDYNIIQLAIAVVVGSAVKELVSSLANNIIMPFIGILTPSGAWRDISFMIMGAEFKLGLFLSSFLDFVIVALVVFIVLKKILKVDIKK